MNNPTILDNPTDGNDDILIPASTVRRFGNYLIDSILLWIVISIVCRMESNMWYYKGYLIDITRIWVTFLSFFAYYTIMEAVFGKTIGKLITRTRVVTESGNKPGFGICLLRTICRFIPFEPFSVFTGIGWHDSIARTVVIEEHY